VGDTRNFLVVSVPRNYVSENAGEDSPCRVHSIYDVERKKLIDEEKKRGIFPRLLEERESVSPTECLEIYLGSLEMSGKFGEAAEYVRGRMEKIDRAEKTEMAVMGKLFAPPSNTIIYER
jgi:hypothetical protein